MEKEKGHVIKTEGNKADILLHSKEVCGHCGARFSCADESGVQRVMTLQNRLDAKVGDQVEIVLSEKNKIYSALLIFLMPLVFIFVGYYLTTSVFHIETTGIWGAVLGFLTSGVILWVVNKIVVKNQSVTPQMKRLIYQHI